MLSDCRKCGLAFVADKQEKFCSACQGLLSILDRVTEVLIPEEVEKAWDDGNHDELHVVCSCWSPTPPEVDKESSGVLNYSEIETKDSNTDKRRFSMDLQSLLDNLNSVISNGQDQLYGLEDKRSSIESIENEIQDAVSNLEDIQGQLEDACSTLQNLEENLIPQAEDITAY